MARLNAKWDNFNHRGQVWYHFWNDTFSSNTIPIVYLQSESKIVISDETGFTTSVVTFIVNKDCDQWEARADGNGNPGVGLLVGSGSSIIANVEVSFNVDYNELTNGDKIYSVDVLAHNSVGWSVRT
jgi:hypothetical protein